jgi:arylsulfatase A-like enzyme
MKVLTIIANRLQPAYLGCYGNDWLTTAAIDRLAAEGVVYDQHFADRASPQGARRSWQQGAARSLPPGCTAAIIGDERSPTRRSAFARGFGRQQWITAHELPHLEQESLLGAVVQAACEWVQEHHDRQHWLLWLELGSLQLPWDSHDYDPEACAGYDEAALKPLFDPPAGRIGRELTVAEKERAAATYAGMVSGLDQWLGQLFDFLKQKGWYDDLTIVFTADCGLPLGEHGTLGDVVPWLHEERVHLPLIVRFPGGIEAGRRVQHLTQAVDLLPTIFEVLGEPAAAGEGQSLVAVARGDSRKLREFAPACLRIGNELEWSLRTRHWLLLAPLRSTEPTRSEPLLFIKPDDRWEVNDVRRQHLDAAEHLELALWRHIAARRSNSTLTPEIREDVLRIVEP